jgi:hypothetical protein
MGVAIELRGRTKASQSPRELIMAITQWLRANAGELIDRVQEIQADSTPWLMARLHPIAEDIRVGALPGGDVVVQAKTSPVGPGYHVFVCELFKRLGVALKIDWDKSASADDSDYFATGQRELVEKAMLSWIADVSRRVLFLPPGSGAVALSMPSDTVFHADAHVLTPLGPRDTTWLRRVAADDPLARDFFAWWPTERGPEVMLAHALCLMWTDVRWHEPANAQERELLTTVSRWLDRAHRLDISLDHPWREWAEILRALGQDKGPLYDMVTRRAERVPEGTPLVGYRRGPVSLQLHGGWRVTVPGSFAITTGEDGSMTAQRGDRRVVFTPVTVAREDTPASALLDGQDAGPDAAPSTGASDEVYANEAGALRARSRVRAREGGGHRLGGAIAAPGALARMTIDFDAEGDRKWALLTFASVSHERAGAPA